jgi:DNA/RNA-binding domain of Phe-tRNA-synthetase-like protein
VRFADGSESFLAHDQDEVENPERGEVIFCDDTGLVFARRWCWKQSRQSVVTGETTVAVITIESQHPGGRQSIDNALNDLSELMQRYLGGTYQQGVVEMDQLEIRSE